MVFPDNRAKASGLALSAAAARPGSVHVMETVRPKSIASQSVVRHGPVFGLLFFGVFLLVGSVLSYFLLWRPWTRVQAAKTWPAHPCTVVSSRVRTHNDSDSTTYRVEIAYVAAADLAKGAARFTLPADSVPSFRSTNNRIIWAIDVRGDIPRWPDLKEEFEIQVRPGARMAMA